MPLLLLPVKKLSLDSTLASGQTFCWRYEGQEAWLGWIHQHPCRLALKHQELSVESPSAQEKDVLDYFQIHSTWDRILKSLPDDPWLAQALTSARGLRCVHEPWWECIANFICSALKQISQNLQINAAMRNRFGISSGWENMSTYPTPSQIAQLSENDLRKCGLGFRAKHLLNAARQIDSGKFVWEKIRTLSTEEASLELQTLAGVGHKVAHCILLHAANRWDAFPIDVWVERLLMKLYFPKKRMPLKKSELATFAREHFGPYRGIAQLYLFHWFRTQSTSHSRKKPEQTSRQNPEKNRANKRGTWR